MPDRRLPVHPSIEHLRQEAADLLGAGDPAIRNIDDARSALARDYGASDWQRLERACQLVDAIWADDLATVQSLVSAHRALVHEDALVRKSNWGRPMSYAANLGRDRIITFLHENGATDHEFALERAALQGQVGTARLLHAMLGSPPVAASMLAGPGYTLNEAGTALLFELGADVRGAGGGCVAPIHVVLESDSRRPPAKHEILEMYARHGCELPDTPMMALHRGRFDLLERHLRADPALVRRTFTFAEIFPPELGCEGEWLPRTPMAGSTLLHAAVEFDELEIAKWLLTQGTPVDVPAAVDDDGFGGHTALFNAVVCFPNFWGGQRGASFAQLFLENGANPNARASLQAKTQVDDVWRVVDHRDVTPLGWGQRFEDRRIASEPAMQLVAESGGNAA